MCDFPFRRFPCPRLELALGLGFGVRVTVMGNGKMGNSEVDL